MRYAISTHRKVHIILGDDFDDRGDSTGRIVAKFECGNMTSMGRLVDDPEQFTQCEGCFQPEQARLRREARTLINRAVKSGLLVRQPCEECGSPKSQAHHDDYTKPLKVRWLCTRDHAKWHKALRDSFEVAS